MPSSGTVARSGTVTAAGRSTVTLKGIRWASSTGVGVTVAVDNRTDGVGFATAFVATMPATRKAAATAASRESPATFARARGCCLGVVYRAALGSRRYCA